MEISITETKERINQIINWLTKIKEKTNCRGVVIGLSGGKDSTTVAMLAKRVWGDNMLGVMMPNGYQSDLDDSIKIAQKLNIKYKIIDIGGTYSSLIDSIETVPLMDSDGLPLPTPSGVELNSKTKTNIPPRLRMTVLYAIAQSLGYRVIGTGNLSEAYVGWCTKWGDSAYDFNPIGNLTCSEVKEIGRVLANEYGLPLTYIDKAPSDGLTGKSDEENFGFTYDMLDEYILSGSISDEAAKLKIDNMHNATYHKREMPITFITPRL